MNEISPTLTWPPAYSIKKHRRARHVKLRAVPSQGLVLTVPYRFNLKEIPAILEEHKAWITKQLQQLQLPSQSADTLPEKIELFAMNETWTIFYMQCDTKLEIIERPHQEIVLIGNVNDQKLCKEKLIFWVRNKAKKYLIAQLDAVGEMTQLTYENVTIRDQQTLWGSCTVKKSISLNYKLIFLPNHLVRHVIIHELCHTKHLNHSMRFWRLVAKYDPTWESNRRELRRADKYIPAWVIS
jgi:predicted metal-dependent hydrolase